jgi:hypothetical protein
VIAVDRQPANVLVFARAEDDPSNTGTGRGPDE